MGAKSDIFELFCRNSAFIFVFYQWTFTFHKKLLLFRKVFYLYRSITLDSVDEQRPKRIEHFAFQFGLFSKKIVAGFSYSNS
jgi:hypothetical protein